MVHVELDRFVKLAFCRADILLELSDKQEVVFAAGASQVIFGSPPEKLPGTPFITLIADGDRTMAQQILVAAGEQGRLDDAILRLNGTAGRTPRAVIAGYRAADFDGHFFVAIKIDARTPAFPGQPAQVERADDSGLLEEGSFSKLAADRVQAFQSAGGRAQITLLRMDKLNDLLTKVGASKKKELLGAIGDALRRNSLGGDTAAHMDEENFSFVHAENVDVDGLNKDVAAAARKIDAAGADVTGYYETLDCDGAGLSEEQVAKAVIHTMKRFCQDGSTGRTKSISQVVNTMMTDTVKTVATIRRISENVEIDLVFMPICDLRLGKVHHFEMLTRFRDPQYAKSPFQLITLAEEVEIIHDLDMAICRKAIGMIEEFNKKEPIPPVAVNLSGQSLDNDRFVEALHKLLRKTRPQPGKLMFEITESARVENLENVNRNMQTFRKAGYKFALDDFGAGSASFDYLNMLDADYVKFDGPVVRRACSTGKGGELLTTMAKMCANQHILTVAEMVEDSKMANQVYYCGIDYGQGWHFGKPSPDPYEFADRFVARVVDKTGKGK
ncbi:MAG: EAL domain-containing protein [Alphaproteobacteria bacterium]